MMFNSLSFALFMPFIFFVYWFGCRRNLRLQNILLLVASYFFYACWDWRFMFLLLASTCFGYISGYKINTSPTQIKRKLWLWCGCLTILSLLIFFKYFNFFTDSFADLLRLIGFTPHITTLNIILPIGISFYTFHGLSYILDIYNRKIEPTHSFVNYGVFISFFPLLIAGPIERATHLLPQVEKPRTFEYRAAVDGLKQILWGFFKKVAIADSCAALADPVFMGTEPYSGSTYALAAILFAIQIYADFSGYSDIAIGVARLLGFNILHNFNYPYFSRNIAEFWRRWHISLTSWFRDYLYIPLGGSRQGKAKTIRNTFIIFLVSGLWHGANWTFVVWGFIHALMIIPSILTKNNRKYLDTVAQGRIFPSPKEFFNMSLTFFGVAFALIFFRSQSIEDAFSFIGNMFDPSFFSLPSLFSGTIYLALIFFFIVEWIGRKNKYAIQSLSLGNSRWLRWGFYYLIIFVVLYFSDNGQHQFIYFQF